MNLVHRIGTRGFQVFLAKLPFPFTKLISCQQSQAY